jgi:hypothetical protein
MLDMRGWAMWYVFAVKFDCTIAIFAAKFSYSVG